jgi:hypothetical protein
VSLGVSLFLTPSAPALELLHSADCVLADWTGLAADMPADMRARRTPARKVPRLWRTFPCNMRQCASSLKPQACLPDSRPLASLLLLCSLACNTGGVRFDWTKKERRKSALFFVGAKGSGVSFHEHTNAYNGLVYGRK